MLTPLLLTQHHPRRGGPAPVDAVMGNPHIHAVKPFPGIPVGEDEIAGAGGYGKAQPVAF